MPTLSGLATDDVITVVLDDHPDVREALVVAWEQAWHATDPVRLELCRLRIAMLLGCAPELAARTPAAIAAGFAEEDVAALQRWPSSPRFGPAEQACLAFTEQFVIDVAGLDDATAGAVRAELGDEGFVDFVNALLVVEQRQRLRLTWERLLDA